MPKITGAPFDKFLIELQNLFVTSTIQFQKVQQGYFVRPISHLAYLIVNNNTNIFFKENISKKSHYDINHPEASRLVCSIENFFRDYLGTQIVNQNASAETDYSKKISDFLGEFRCGEAEELKLVEFLRDEVFLDDKDLSHVKNILKERGFWMGKNDNTYQSFALNRKKRSKLSDDFDNEDLDLLYFLNLSQWQHVIRKRIKIEDLPEKKLTALFDQLTVVRNDVSHNRPVSSKRLLELKSDFDQIKIALGKVTGEKIIEKVFRDSQ